MKSEHGGSNIVRGLKTKDMLVDSSKRIEKYSTRIVKIIIKSILFYTRCDFPFHVLVELAKIAIKDTRPYLCITGIQIHVCGDSDLICNACEI